MDSILLFVAFGAAVAGFVQGLSGFAFGLVAMSIWAWFLEPRLAATLAVFGALLGQILAAFTVRRRLDLRLLLPFVAGGVLGIPIGTTLLPMLDMNWFKAILGGLLVLWCPAMLMTKHLPTIAIDNRYVDGFVGLAGGVLGGIGGFTGTLPTLWCTLRGLQKDTQRALIQNFNLALLSVTMATYFATGLVTVDVWPLFAVVAPAMLIPGILGGRMYTTISEAGFRKLILSLLTATGVALLASSITNWVKLAS